MGLFRIVSGEAFEVRASSEEEALAKFYVAQGFEDTDEYEGLGYSFDSLDDDVSYLETDTVADRID